MFRLLYRVGLLLGAAILALFVGARLIHMADPYRVVTENLIRQVAAEPQRTARLNEYGTVALQVRQSLHTENAAAWAAWLDNANATALIDWIPFRTNVKLVAIGVDTAVHKIAAFDKNLKTIEAASPLSYNLTQLRFYDLDRGDMVLADLYRQSTAVSYSLSDMSEGLGDVTEAVTVVTNFPVVETIQQELLDAKNTAASIAAGNGGLLSKVIPQDVATEFFQLADFIYLSIENWQGIPSNMQATKQQIDGDIAWLANFEQEYRAAKAVNDRWHFDMLRRLSRFEANFHQSLLLGAIGSLLLALVGWIGSHRPAYVPQAPPTRQVGPPVLQPVPAKLPARLAFSWPDGRQDCQTLPQAGELTIGNIVIRRARVRYYLECIDNAFPTRLNGHTICGARTLNDGDVLQIGELQTTFQLAA
jgi:hypothetical protein